MEGASGKKAAWKQRLWREFVRYWVNFLYLALFFSAFTWYERLVLEEYRIVYLNYGVSILEALVLAKLILIGDAIGFGKRLNDMPLVYPCVCKAVIYTAWVGFFKLIEKTVIGLFHHQGLLEGLHAMLREGKYLLLAHCLVTFCVFVPFFAFRELARALGEGKMNQLFFRAGISTGTSAGAGPVAS